MLTLLAATVWGLYNAGYIVYLSFAPRVLMAGGYGPAQAAAIISLASWVMILSGPIGGRLADRSGRGALMLYVCTAVGIASLLLLQHTALAVLLSLLFGLFGGAPAGVIMALTGEAMAPQRRAFGMGVFFSFYFVLHDTGPAAGRLAVRPQRRPLPCRSCSRSLLFVGAALSHALFGVLKRQSGGRALTPSAAPPAP